MWRRGGYGTGLMERFGKFKAKRISEPQGVVYIHAVSVGEVLIAQKLIKEWLEVYPEERIVLAATTSTGLVLAKEKSPDCIRVIYSPLDFSFILRSVFCRFKPRQIVLIEAEMWPNFLNLARKSEIPVAVVNARLSQRSEARFHKVAGLVNPLFEMVSLFAVQNKDDAERFEKLGVTEEKIHITGSIKFDPSGGTPPQRRHEFNNLLQDFGKDRPVVLAASTHAGEEKLIGHSIKKLGTNALFLVIPRHAERRAAVRADLEAAGYEVCLRSDYQKPMNPEQACFVADTTGELRDWTAHADLIVIGKSILGEGGQNPAEAIMAGVPVITMLRAKGGVKMISSEGELSHVIENLLDDQKEREKMTAAAREVLLLHEKAVAKTLDLVYVDTSAS